MIPITIDFTDTISDNFLSRNEADRLISSTIMEIRDGFAEHWRKVAIENLRGSGDIYAKSIYVGEEGKFKGYVALQGWFPNALENGVDPFDMKIGFSKSRSVKSSKNGGWYLTIPFRHSTPGAIGGSSIFSSSLPKEIHKAIKSKADTKSKAFDGVKYGKGLNTSELPKEYRELKTRKPITIEGKIVSAYKHKNPIYLGIQKQTKVYAGAEQAQYSSFRRVSNNSDPLSWMHKGFTAKKLGEIAINSFGEKMTGIVQYMEEQFLQTK
ncbi:MAG TPA: hypothetical protein PKY56_00170 [Candidatus Kapabacteria bacterium]|nr:hypothetical protein [Candidatus Kapabacteria bacterium]